MKNEKKLEKLKNKEKVSNCKPYYFKVVLKKNCKKFYNFSENRKIISY